VQAAPATPPSAAQTPPKTSRASTSKPGEALANARLLYNQGKYDEAIVAATQARQVPASADAAAIVFARAHLERYRQRAEAQDLTDARTALTTVDDTKLHPREHMELVVGLGEALYFDGRLTAAAEFFEVALGHLDLLEPDARDLLFEWWAGALGQQAELGPDADRRSLYTRILARAEEELRRDDRSPMASYWLAAAARGTNDLDRAWGAALAGWVRAPLTGARGVKLRNDLDRFVTLVLIPERARQLAGTVDAKASAALLEQQWMELKEKYGGG